MNSLPMPESMLERCGECMGERKDVSELVSKNCSKCEGEGVLQEVECDVCCGKGCEFCLQSGVLENVQCPNCEGMGELRFHPPCPYCNGSGKVPSKEFYLV